MKIPPCNYRCWLHCWLVRLRVVIVSHVAWAQGRLMYNRTQLANHVVTVSARLVKQRAATFVQFMSQPAKTVCTYVKCCFYHTVVNSRVKSQRVLNIKHTLHK